MINLEHVRTAIRSRRRAWLALSGVTLVGVLVAGCASVVNGNPQGLPAPQSSTPVPSTSPDFSGQPSGSASTSSPVSTPSTVAPTPIAPATLHALLMPAPAGSHRLTGKWAELTYPTLTQFVTEYYQPTIRSGIAGLFKNQGLTSITHRVWANAAGTQCDVLLFAFATAAGAQARYQTAAGAQSRNAGIEALTVGDTAHPARGFRAAKPDSSGYTTGVVYSMSGRVTAEIFTYTPKKRFDALSTRAWARTQIARLPG